MKNILLRINLANLVLLGTSAYIFLSFLVFYLVDLRNAFGLRDILLDTSGVYFYFTYVPFFFQHYGRDGGFAEVAQWILLAGTIILAAFYAGKFSGVQKLVSRFWMVMALGFTLMLLEDAGEIRHLFMSYVQWMAGEPDQGLYGTLFEGICFLILGGLPIYALWKYGHSIRKHGKVFIYMLLGIIAHAVAASLSFVGTAFQMTIDTDVYSLMGEKFKQGSLYLGTSDLPEIWDAWDANNWLYQVDFYLMDSFVEENIELLGNAFFLAAAVSVYGMYNKRQIPQS
jgi:hypothetical protein